MKILWDVMPQRFRKALIWSLWFITWVGLLLGLKDKVYYEYIVLFSAAHLLLFWVLLRFQTRAFPVQVRIAYLAWVIIGTYVPHMMVLMYITTIGLASNLFLGYCPLARMLYLLPFNRKEPLTFHLIKRVFLTPPVAGQFKPS